MTYKTIFVSHGKLTNIRNRLVHNKHVKSHTKVGIELNSEIWYSSLCRIYVEDLTEFLDLEEFQRFNCLYWETQYVMCHE